MKQNTLIIYFLISLVVLFSCCINEKNLMPSQIDVVNPDQFVAITLTIRDNGTLVSGDIPINEGAQPPIAFFDSSGQYNPLNYPPNYPPKNESLKILVGIINIEDSPQHLKTNLDHVIGIYNLPYTLKPGLIITGMDKNGTIIMSYDNESLNLGTGATWISPIISIRNETITHTFPAINGTNYTFTINYSRTYEVINKGVFNK